MTEIPLKAGPPGWAEALLRSILRVEDRDVISGDLLEEHHDIERLRGRRAANRRYLAQVTSVCAFEARRHLSAKYLAAACCIFLFESLISSAQPPALPIRAAITPDQRLFLFVVAAALFVTIAGTVTVACYFVFLVTRRRQVAPKRFL
jgi:hypothetical protein